MPVSSRPPAEQLRHRSPQFVLLVVGALLVSALVVMALLSLAGWL